MADEGEEVEITESELSQPACPLYEELLEVMEREKEGVAQGRLDERFLSAHNHSREPSLSSRSPCRDQESMEEAVFSPHPSMSAF